MRKRLVLLRRIYGLNEQKSKKVIGLIGTHPGVGVTHTGLLLAEFLGNRMGKETAFLEMNMHKDFEKMEDAYYGTGAREDKVFKIGRVHYHKQVEQGDTTDILNERYEYIIIDFGSIMGKNRNEFLRCDIKMVVSSLTDWRREALYQFVQMNRETKGYDSWIFLFVFGQKRDLLELRKEVRLNTRTMGYEPIPYLLSKETIRLFHSVI